MNVQIIRVVGSMRRRRARGTTFDRAYALASVDGFRVRCTEGKGWDCSCSNDECQHPDALASLLDPDVLTMLEREEK